MVRHLVSGLALCVVMVVAVVALSAQGGRGTPQPLSTSPFDVWSGDKLDAGNLGNFGRYTASVGGGSRSRA